MAQVEITDQKSFAAWLKTRPAADDDILVARIGLRVFPLWGRRMEQPWAVAKKLTALPILRILLIKSIAPGDKRKYNRTQASLDAAKGARAANALDADVYAAAVAATAFLLSDAQAEDYAYAASVAAEAADAGNALRIFWSAISVDANALQNGQDPSRLPLWPDVRPDWWASEIVETHAIWDKDPDT